jgi:hypothetical protein
VPPHLNITLKLEGATFTPRHPVPIQSPVVRNGFREGIARHHGRTLLQVGKSYPRVKTDHNWAVLCSDRLFWFLVGLPSPNLHLSLGCPSAPGEECGTPGHTSWALGVGHSRGVNRHLILRTPEVELLKSGKPYWCPLWTILTQNPFQGNPLAPLHQCGQKDWYSFSQSLFIHPPPTPPPPPKKGQRSRHPFSQSLCS